MQKLISIPSHWALPEREKPVANYLKELFQSNGVEAYLQEVVDGRPNVIATLPGCGNGQSLMLNGHIDTVPPYGMKDPFRGIINKGKLYGRGAADMKSGVGTMAYALILLKRLEIQLEGDLIFAGVIDEDAAGSAGTHHLIKHGPLTSMAIVGEPTCLHPSTAHKGIDCYEVSFSGKSVHSSVPQNGVNAIYAAATFINKIESEMIPMYAKLEHPLVGAPTVNVGLIEGTAKANRPFLKGESQRFAGIVPDECRVYLDVRWTPNQTITEITSEIEKFAESVAKARPEVGIKVKYLPWPHPAMEISADHELVKVLDINTKLVTGSSKPVPGATYWGDSGLLYTLAGIPTILFGPGDIGCAHSDEEYVETEQLAIAALIFALTAMDLCGVASG